MLTTHEDFKSVYPSVQDAETMDDYVGAVLPHQHAFERRTTPWEKSLWDEEELQNLMVDLEKIDRLYYIDRTDMVGGQIFTLSCRMDYNGKSVYVQLFVRCKYTGFDCDGIGIIFVSQDANLFMNITATTKYPIDLIRHSLAEDGIHLDEEEEYDKCTRMYGSDVPMLKYLCHLTVDEHKEKLDHYKTELPPILKDSIDKFIRTKEAQKDYDDWVQRVVC